MATIQRRARKNGAQSYRVQVRRKGQVFSATFSTWNEAREWATKIESGIQRQYTVTGGVTLGELLQRYQQEVFPRKKPRTQINQAKHLAWWMDVLGPRPMPDVTPARLATYRDELAATLQAGTVNQYLRTLSHVLSVAIREWGLLESNPMRRVQLLSEPRGRVRFLSDEERASLLISCQAIDRSTLYPVVMLALATGARKMELLRLTWPQLSLGRELMTLHDTKNGEPRSIPVTGQALDVMRKHAKLRKLGVALVFPRADGRGPKDIRYAWRQALELAEIENFRFHDLRHSTASYLAMNGASLVEIADVLGHKTLSMVKRYAHLSEGHTRAVLDRMTQEIFK